MTLAIICQKLSAIIDDPAMLMCRN